MTRIFYQNGNLITVSKNDHYHSFFRSTSHIFAELSTDNHSKQELLTTDTKNSIMGAHDGVEKEDHTYSVFGHSETLPPKRTLQGFNGEFIDKLLGAYQLGQGYRTYSPRLMRFQSPDNLSPFGQGGVNCYTYCNGDPVNYTDPTGHTLVHLKNGQTMRVSKNSAVALPHTFKPSTLKRTTSHASALKAGAPKYARAPEDHFKRIGEPDVFESIISNLEYRQAAAFSNTSRHNSSHVAPILDRYISLVKDNDASMGAARAGVLPGVPSNFGKSLGLGLNPYLQDINSLRDIPIQELGGVRNAARLIRLDREREARIAFIRSDSIDSLIGE